MLRNMATSLIRYERIETTLAKAMALRKVVEKLVTLAKRGDHKPAIRDIRHYVREANEVYKLRHLLAERYRFRPGGFTRVAKTRERLVDSAKMAYIEFVDREGELRPARPVDQSTLDRNASQPKGVAKNRPPPEPSTGGTLRPRWALTNFLAGFSAERKILTSNTAPR